MDDLKKYEITHGDFRDVPSSPDGSGSSDKKPDSLYGILQREHVLVLAKGEGAVQDKSLYFATQVVNQAAGRLDPSDYQSEETLHSKFFGSLYKSVLTNFGKLREKKGDLEAGLTAAVIDSFGWLHYSNLGDSKLYVFREEKLHPLDSGGEGSTIKAGAAAVPKYYIEKQELAGNDLILLVTDSVYKTLGEDNIKATLGRLTAMFPNPNAKALNSFGKALCDQALAAGATEEVRVIISYLSAEKNLVDGVEVDVLRRERDDLQKKFETAQENVNLVAELNETLTAACDNLEKRLEAQRLYLEDIRSGKDPLIRDHLREKIGAEVEERDLALLELQEELASYKGSADINPIFIELREILDISEKENRGLRAQLSISDDPEASFGEDGVVMGELHDSIVDKLKLKIKTLNAHLADYDPEEIRGLRERLRAQEDRMGEMENTITVYEGSQWDHEQQIEDLETEAEQWRPEMEQLRNDNQRLQRENDAFESDPKRIGTKGIWRNRIYGALAATAVILAVSVVGNFGLGQTGRDALHEFRGTPTVAEYTIAADHVMNNFVGDLARDRENCGRLVEDVNGVNDQFRAHRGSEETYKAKRRELDRLVKSQCPEDVEGLKKDF